CLVFLQAEDGIRVRNVTGVQTCALPIFSPARGAERPVSPSRRSRRSSAVAHPAALEGDHDIGHGTGVGQACTERVLDLTERASEIGRASCRERGYVEGCGGERKSTRDDV